MVAIYILRETKMRARFVSFVADKCAGFELKEVKYHIYLEQVNITRDVPQCELSLYIQQGRDHEARVADRDLYTLVLVLRVNPMLRTRS